MCVWWGGESFGRQRQQHGDEEEAAKGKGVKTNIHFEENHNEHQCDFSGGALIKSTVK